MVILPAIDIMGGKCVMLKQGDIKTVTVYDRVPARAAKRWEDAGAKMIHVVDLEGAFEGRPFNIGAIEKILESVKVPIQLGGGIRNLKTVEELLAMGVGKVILGTAALKDDTFLRHVINRHPSKVIIGIDARDGLVAIEGWRDTSNVKALTFAKQLEGLGVSTIIFTDITRDGMLNATDFSSTAEIINNTSLRVIASGGVSRVEHLLKLKKIGAYGAIIGKALYTGRIHLKEVIDSLGG